MKENDPTNVAAAFEMLLEEVETEIEFVNNAGAEAFKTGNYERVDEAREHAGNLATFRQEVADLRRRWQELSTSFNVEEDDDETKTSRRDLGRLKRGVRTPEDAFRLPILQVLNDLEGAGIVKRVLTQVEKMMRSDLSEADYEPLPSTPKSTRWYNTAQWARNSMVNEGLLKDDSPRGTWEISEQGRRYLKENSQ